MMTFGANVPALRERLEALGERQCPPADRLWMEIQLGQLETAQTIASALGRIVLMLRFGARDYASEDLTAFKDALDGAANGPKAPAGRRGRR